LYTKPSIVGGILDRRENTLIISLYFLSVLDAYYILFYDISLSLLIHSVFAALGERLFCLVVKPAVLPLDYRSLAVFSVPEF
jgi:hypothetical protein